MVSPSKDGLTFNTTILSEYLAALKNVFANTNSDTWKEILNESPEAICADYAKIIADLIHNFESRVELSIPLPRSAIDLSGILQHQANLPDKKKYAENLKQLREGLDIINGYDAEVLENVGPDENNSDPLPNLIPLKKFIQNFDHQIKEIASEAPTQLLKKLRKGEIKAWGFRSPLSGKQEREEIERLYWEMLNFEPDGSAKGQGIRYVNILFKPSQTVKTESHEAKKRRTQGDRLKTDPKLILEQLRERARAGKLKEILKEEALILENWCRLHHPPARSASSIQKDIRDEYKVLLAEQQRRAARKKLEQ